MDKQQPLPIVKHEIKKDRVPSFPYHAVCTVHQTKNFAFLVTVDYSNNCAQLHIYPFKEDMSKLATNSISLEEIMPRKIISLIHVLDIQFKAALSSVSITSLELLLGYRSGQIIILEYQNKECKIKCRLNKALKSDGFMFRATSMFFASEDSYSPYFAFPARNYLQTSTSSDSLHSYLVGNSIMLSKQLNQGKQSKFLTQHEQTDIQKLCFESEERKFLKGSDLVLYCNQNYSSMMESSSEYKLLTMKDQVASYALDLPQNQLYIASKDHLFVLHLDSFIIKRIIETQTPIRKINLFANNKHSFVAILLYENYFLWYSVDKQRYLKVAGHKSFVANVHFDQQERKLFSAGMDHRLCILNEKNIKEESWRNLSHNAKLLLLDQLQVKEVVFDEIFGLGQGNNNKGKNNMMNYGYGDLLAIKNCYCLPTFDNRIVIYEFK